MAVGLQVHDMYARSFHSVQLAEVAKENESATPARSCSRTNEKQHQQSTILQQGPCCASTEFFEYSVIESFMGSKECKAKQEDLTCGLQTSTHPAEGMGPAVQVMVVVVAATTMQGELPKRTATWEMTVLKPVPCTHHATRVSGTAHRVPCILKAWMRDWLRLLLLKACISMWQAYDACEMQT